MTEITNTISEFAGLETLPKKWDAFVSKGLPGRKSEEYKFTPITAFLEKEFSEFNEPSPAPSEKSVKDLFATPYKIIFRNGRLISSFESTDILVVKSNTELPEDPRFQPEWKDEFHFMNQGLKASGLYIRLNKSKTLDHPIYIQHIVDKEESKSTAIVRNFIHAEENSELSVVEEFIYNGDQTSFENIESHIIVDSAARVKSYKLQLEGNSQIQVGNTFVQQETKSYHKNVTISMEGRMIRNNIQVFLNDEHCESHLYGLYMLNGKNHVDNHSTVDHKMPNCYSNELYKGILSENSTGVFNGKIFVRPDAQKTNAFQSNNNLLLSDTATLHTKPQLEIWADDVSCSHGCTSGQLDEEAMFYLRSRGLDKQQSKALLLKAFVSDVLHEIDIEPIKNTVETKVDHILFH